MGTEPNSEWEELQRHFLAALPLSAGEREQYLGGLDGNPGLRAEVQELLQAMGSSEGLLGSSLVRGPENLGPGTLPQVAGFTIVGELGRGGMGVVYEALQDKPRRSVALKVLAAGLFSPGIAKRFEREAHLLARLQHIGIAQIYESGVAEAQGNSMPYFAMELVEGRNLIRYAAEQELDTRARLELIAQICDAVQHAHQRGIIHRDLKPSNILVTSSGQTKILDFGVARNTDSDLLRTTFQTDVGQLIGTLPYMSPEQTTGNPEMLDTRSDVYAVGVLCYELLAGRLPYKLQREQLVDAVRIIQTQDPLPLRDTNSDFRGDVETIVGKALEKAPDRRYSAASELAADIRRHLNHQPIEARPASRLYQLQKFSQRHRALVGSVLLLLLVLSVAVVATTKLAMDRQVALTEATASKTVAQRREANARSVLRFLEVDVLGQASPFVPVDRNLTLADALTNAAHALDGRFPTEPEIEWSLRMTLARTLNDLSHFAESERQGLRGTELAELCFGAQSSEWRAAQRLLGEVEGRQGRYQEAVARLRELLDLETELLAAGHVDRIRTLGHLGDLTKDLGDDAAAVSYLEEAIALAVESNEVSAREVWSLRQELASAWMSQGDSAEARELLERILEAQTHALGADHPGALDTQNSLAILLKDTGEFEQAAELCLQLIPRCEAVFGKLHANTLSSKTVLAGAYQNLGRFAEALELELGNLEDLENTLGGESVEACKTRGQIADSMLRLGRTKEARSYAEEALEGLLATVGDEHYFTMLAIGRLGALDKADGKFEAAIERFEQALEISTALFGSDHTQTAAYLHNMAAVLESQGNLEAAAELYREAADINEEQLGVDNPTTLTSLSSLAGVLVRRGELEDAERIYKDVIDGFERAVGPDFWIRGSALLSYSECLSRAGRLEDSVTAAKEAVSILEKTFGPTHPRTVEARAQVKRLKDIEG